MSGNPYARRILLPLAFLLVLGAVAYRFMGGQGEDTSQASAPEEIVAIHGCGTDRLDEAQVTATHAVWADSVGDEFSLTDFSIRSIALDEITFDGNTRDSIPPVGTPQFIPVGEALALGQIGELEPVLSVGINGDFRAYPLRILLWHEIVNDEIGGVPVLIAYCPLCNSGLVFDRRVGDQVLEFGNTGRIRFHDMVMYDKGTESWWQQAMGEAVIGELTGTCMKPLPARQESVARFRERAPEGQLLVPENPDARQYGITPFRSMIEIPPNMARNVFPYPVPEGVNPMDKVVVVGDQGWTLPLLQSEEIIEADEFTLTWIAGQNSIHDAAVIAEGRDIGNVVVQRDGNDGPIDVPYDVVFAFAFAAFYPNSTLHSLDSARPSE